MAPPKARWVTASITGTWGQGSHVTRIMGSALGITRGPKQVRAAAPERIGLGFELRTATGFTHLDVDQVVEPGDLSLTDGTSTCEAFWPGVGGTKLVLIDYDRLGLPVDLVRRAVPHLKASPVYQLVRAHVAMLCEGNDDTSSDLRSRCSGQPRSSWSEPSSSPPWRRARPARSAARHPIHARREVPGRHLADPDLNAESIAFAHNVSVGPCTTRGPPPTGSRWPVDHRRAPRGRAGSAQPRHSGDDDRGRHPPVGLRGRNSLRRRFRGAYGCPRASGNGSTGYRSTLALLRRRP